MDEGWKFENKMIASAWNMRVINTQSNLKTINFRATRMDLL